MPKSPGKQFEEDFEKSIPKDWFYYRLKDCPNAWPGKEGNSKIRFTPKNMCDLFMSTGNVLYGVECKSFLGKSMPYSNIADHQIDGLLEMSTTGPVTTQGVFILNFRDLAETYYLNAFVVNSLKVHSGRKSISIQECRSNGVLIPQTLKRIHYRYNLEVFYDEEI